MTGPRVDPLHATSPHVLTGEEWEAAQHLTGADAARMLAHDPTSEAPLEASSPLHRVLTGEEWERAQGMSAAAIKTWKLPFLPKFARDVTRTPADPNVRGVLLSNDPTGKNLPWTLANAPTKLAGFFTRQLVAPVVEHPLATAGMVAAVPVATAISPLAGLAATVGIGGSMASEIAHYGYQKYLETRATPDVRREMEADPDRASGEAAAAQAMFLGLAPMVHVGVKAIRGPSFGAGMMEAGAKGVGEQRFGPDFAPDHPPTPGENTYLNKRFAAELEDGAETAHAPADVARPAGFQTTATGARLKTNPRALPGLIAPEKVASGKVRPIETEPPIAPMQDRIDLNQSVRDYQSGRASQDAADIAAEDPLATLEARMGESRRQAAATVARGVRIRRRPATEHYFESEQGAELLGAMAARHGLPDDASPYHADSPLDAVWKQGHESATGSFPSYPEGFSMGGALTDNRIPGASEIPATARGTNIEGLQQSHPVEVPDGATAETIALANALKPSRYRTHTTDELAGAALDAQAELERAQAAVTASQTREHRLWEDPEKTPESIFYEDRGVHATDEPSAASEKALAQAKTRLAQIEREFAMRGVSGDGLAEVMQAAKEQRMERDGMQSDETLNAHMGADDPFAEPSRASSLTPVEGTGELRTRGLAAGVQRKAVANKLTETLGDLPEYRSINMADQAASAAEFLAADPALARRVALGEAPPPAHLLPESVFVAVENKAIADGDVGTLRDLANSHLTTEATTMGQRLRTLGERDHESPVGALRSVLKAREAGYGTPDQVQQVIAEQVAKIHAQLAAEVKPAEWAKFLDSLRC